MTRTLHLLAGHACAGLGIVGLFVPLLPTTPFLLLALYFYSRSSTRMHQWMLRHPRFGETLRHWQEHGSIGLRAKVLATSLILLSSAYLVATRPWPLAAQVAIGIGGGILILFLVSRPSPPARPADEPYEGPGKINRPAS